jgi:hypothetical protein
VANGFPRNVGSLEKPNNLNLSFTIVYDAFGSSTGEDSLFTKSARQSTFEGLAIEKANLVEMDLACWSDLLGYGH